MRNLPPVVYHRVYFSVRRKKLRFRPGRFETGAALATFGAPIPPGTITTLCATQSEEPRSKSPYEIHLSMIPAQRSSGAALAPFGDTIRPGISYSYPITSMVKLKSYAYPITSMAVGGMCLLPRTCPPGSRMKNLRCRSLQDWRGAPIPPGATSPYCQHIFSVQGLLSPVCKPRIWPWLFYFWHFGAPIPPGASTLCGLKTLGIGLRYGPIWVRFLVSKVPLILDPDTHLSTRLPLLWGTLAQLLPVRPRWLDLRRCRSSLNLGRRPINFRSLKRAQNEASRGHGVSWAPVAPASSSLLHDSRA